MGRGTRIICGVALALVLSGAAQGPTSAPRSNLGLSGEASPTENVPQVTADLDRIASALEAQNADGDAVHEQRDLDAQESMAKWARNMFWAAVVQAVLSAIGIGLILLTFFETRKAAKSAKDIVDVTRTSAERQLRAYLHAGHLRVVNMLPGKVPHIVFGLKNAGQTPAYEVSLSFVSFADADPDKVRIFRVTTSPSRKLRLHYGPGQAGEMLGYFEGMSPLTTEDIDAFVRREWGMGAAGYVSYRDTFGRMRRTVFRGHAIGARPDDSGTVVMEVTRKHSRAS